MHRRWGWTLLLAAALVGSGGCFFEPRAPEQPAAIEINYLPQDQAANVWENVQKAMNGLDAAGYERQIAEDFTYEPDGQTLATYGDVDWEAWGRETEIAFMTDMLNNVGGIAADLRYEIIFDEPGDTRAELRYIYDVTVTEADGSTTPYRAEVVVEIFIEGTDWVITRWYDVSGESDGGSIRNTLGDRRGAFARSGGG